MELERDEGLEERGNIVQKLVTDKIILRHPPLNAKVYKKIMYDFSDQLIFIKKKEDPHTDNDYIPCLFYRKKESKNFLIYFHGNSENIFQIENYGLDFRSYLKMNILLVEYPGYFLESNDRTNPNIFFKNSLIVYDWIISTFKASDNQIFVCGRSLGTSSAIYLSSHRNPKALFLISAFTSMKNVGSDMFKPFSWFIEEIFKSINYIEDINCPILFIHGNSDKTIPCHHSELLWLKAKERNNNTQLNLRPGKDHNDLNLKEDIIDIIINFCSIKKLLNFENNENMINNIDMIKDEDLYKIPLIIRKKLENDILDINEFVMEKNKNIAKKNVAFLMNLDKERIAAITDSSISIYNDMYLLYYEIDIKKIKKDDVEIRSLYQMKNGNLICATDEGDIFIFKINKKGYEIVKQLSIGEEIYKIGELNENYICLLSKNSIKIYDNNFLNVIAESGNNKTFKNFSSFSNNGLALIKEKTIGLALLDNNKNKIAIHQEIRVHQNLSLNTFVGTTQYLIVGGLSRIYLYNIEKNYQLEKIELLPDEEVTFIFKINDQLFLVSTSKGYILQIIIDNVMQIKRKFIDFVKITSILMVNYETILVSGNERIYVLSVVREGENNSQNCEIF